MKFNILAIALATTAFSTLATAQTTTIIEERRAPSVIVEPAPSTTTTTTTERGGFLGTESRKTTTTETTGAGIAPDCTTKTVRNDNLLGSSTSTRTRCD